MSLWLTILTFPVAVLIGALLWRVRGGYLSLPSTNLGRAMPSLWFGGCAILYTGNWWLGFCAPLLFVAITLPWAEWMDMGNVSENDDLTGMMGRGMLLTLPSGIFLYLMGYAPWFMMFGFMMGIIYWLSWKFGINLRIAGPHKSELIDGATALAELLVGAWLITLLGITLFVPEWRI